MGNENEQLTLKAMFYRGHRSFAPSRYHAVSCPIILAVDACRVKRNSALDVSHSDERNSKSGAPLRCKPAAVLEDAEQWGSDKGVRGRLRDGGAREWCSGGMGAQASQWTRETRKRKGGFERARRVANRNEGPVCRRETKPYRCYR